MTDVQDKQEIFEKLREYLEIINISDQEKFFPILEMC